MDIELMPAFSSLASLRDELVDWLCGAALPLWDAYGVDRSAGGYFESIRVGASTQAIEGTGDVRRGRVVARQIYVFDVGHRLGWRSTRMDPVQHGCDYLFSRLHRGNGLFHVAVDAQTYQAQGPFSLYEHGFYLFALARMAARPARLQIAETAALCLQQLRRNWGRPDGGFEETDPPTQPLKSNPHMHLLEAAMAWIEVSDESRRGPWIELAQELVELCLTRFISTDTGALHEYFDRNWRLMGDCSGRIIEPGHQFEWAWLLTRWANFGYCDAKERQVCSTAAQRLVEIGERWGVDPVRDVAINELWDDMTPKDSAAKLWPQTERIKAWCILLEHAQTQQYAELAAKKITSAALSRYFYSAPAGLWHELMLPDGRFTSEPCKASSFYHIVCAIETLRATLGVVSRSWRTRFGVASSV